MAVRHFSGSGTQDQLFGGVGGLSNLTTGDLTFAALVKRTNTLADEMITGWKDSGGVLREALIVGGGGSHDQLGLQANSGGTYMSGITFTTSDGWMVVAITKAAGSNVPRAHKFVLGGSGTHGGSGSAVGNQLGISGGTSFVGGSTAFGFFVGHIAVVGAINSVLSDTNIESLATSWANWQSLFTGSTAGLWRFDQPNATDTSPDQTGNGADLNTVNNTTVVTGDDPPGFVWAASAASLVGAVAIN